VRARTHLEQALAVYDQERDQHPAPRFVFDDRVVALGWLAVVLWALGKVDEAARLLDDALQLAQKTGHIPTLAWAHAYKCRFAGICRKPALALPHAKNLLKLARKYGLPMRLADGSFYRGWARWCAGDERGQAEVREALTLWNEMDFRLFGPMITTLVAEREGEAGRVEAGLTSLDAQLETIEQTGERWFEAEVQRARGELLLKLHNPDISRAEAALKRAVDIARSQGARAFELRAALSLAKLYHSAGQDDPASKLLDGAVTGFDSNPQLPEIEEAQRLLATLSPERTTRH
jgi:predicted ATPase